jgi:hypothetical protein
LLPNASNTSAFGSEQQKEAKKSISVRLAIYRLLLIKYATKVNPATTKTASKPGSGLLVEPLDCAEDALL